jgi:outer membrane receptor protein involved in Fe transport
MNGLFGLAPSTRIPLEMIERVEVLKGPGSLANGVGPSGSVGGSINVVTKRAADVPLTRLTTTYMGKAQFGTHLDVGRRFGEDNQWGVRVNGVLRNGEGNIDGGKQNLAWVRWGSTTSARACAGRWTRSPPSGETKRVPSADQLCRRHHHRARAAFGAPELLSRHAS